MISLTLCLIGAFPTDTNHSTSQRDRLRQTTKDREYAGLHRDTDEHTKIHTQGTHIQTPAHRDAQMCPETNQHSSTWTFTASGHRCSVQDPSTLRCLGPYSHTTLRQMTGAQRKIHTTRRIREENAEIYFIPQPLTQGQRQRKDIQERSNMPTMWLGG